MPQTASGYRSIWTKNGAGALGALRITELPTSRANAHLQTVARSAPSQARGLRVILVGMFSLAVRFDALPVNPITETRVGRIERKAPRALTAVELEQVRAAVRAYTAGSASGGPKPGRVLPSLVDALAATGGRPSEVLALRWRDIDIDSDPPTVTFGGTLVDHQRHAGRPLHRQGRRKHGAAPHTVTLPAFGVDALRALRGGIDVDPDAPVFASRNGGWLSIANVRRALRAALPEGLSWVTPHSFRRSVATVVRDALGPAEAQQQLSHARLSTTEVHYLQRHTAGPDVRQALDAWFTGDRAGK